MITKQTKLKIEADVDALSRIGAVSNHVAKAENAIDPLSPHIVQNRIQGFDVAVNVAQNGDALVVGHGRNHSIIKLTATRRQLRSKVWPTKADRNGSFLKGLGALRHDNR
jgi:hypothetical protein